MNLFVFFILKYSVPSLKDLQWRVDFVVSSSALKSVHEPFVQMDMKVEEENKETEYKFDMTAQKFRVFHEELKIALEQMKKFKNSE